MASWNGLDFFVFLIFVVNTMLGMVRGATREIISMMGLSAALIMMLKFTVPLANFFNSSPVMATVVQSDIMNNFMLAIGAGPITLGLLQELFFSISMLIWFVGTYSICEATLAFPGFMEMFSFPYAALNRKVGAALGAVRGYVIILVFLVIFSFHIFKPGNNTMFNSNNIVAGSYFAQLFQGAAAKLNNLIAEQKPERYQEIYQDKNLYNDKNVMQILKPPVDEPAAPTNVPAAKPEVPSGSVPVPPANP